MRRLALEGMPVTQGSGELHLFRSAGSPKLTHVSAIFTVAQRGSMIGGLEIWAMWIIAGIVLFIAEIFTLAFFLASVGTGCLATGLAMLLFNLGFKGQLVTLCVGTIVSAFTVRPLLLRYCYRPSRGIKTNVDALPGRSGRVLEAIDPTSAKGRVRIGGEDWKATSADNTFIDEGINVIVVAVDGNKVVVKRVEREHEPWESLGS
jgi:membrane protein implicated in regulation of membrane protease activity